MEQARPVTFKVSLLARLLSGAVRTLYSTLHVTATREAEVEALRREHGGVILVTWHGLSLIPVARSRGKGYVGIVSFSRDGDLLTEFFRRMGWRAIRGSTGRGGARAAKAAIDAMNANEGPGTMLAITPDGPRGPARKAQPGAVFLAQKSGKPLVPVGISASRAWRVRSWDSFLIPKPFSRVVWLYGEPMFFGPDDDVSLACLRIEEAINALEAQASHETGKQRGWRPSPPAPLPLQASVSEGPTKE